jgi:hypothetical protein
MGRTRQRSTQSQDLAGPCDAQRQASPDFRGHREFGPAFAQHEHTSRRLPFLKKAGAAGVDGDRLDGVKSFQRIGRQIAKEPVRAKEAIEAAL